MFDAHAPPHANPLNWRAQLADQGLAVAGAPFDDSRSDHSASTIRAQYTGLSSLKIPPSINEDASVSWDHLSWAQHSSSSFPSLAPEVGQAFAPYTYEGNISTLEQAPSVLVDESATDENRSSLGLLSIITDSTSSDASFSCGAQSSVQLIAQPIQPKCRVETQVKMQLNLVFDSSHPGARPWRWLRLPFTASVKQPRYFDHETIVSDTLLLLHAEVVRATEPNVPVNCCAVCYAREAKRRPRYYPLPQDPDTPTSAIDFTCEPIFDLSSGTVALTFRIICYCRHHSEKRGFYVDFSVKDRHGCVVGRTRSTPILITDDRRPALSVASSHPMQTAERGPRGPRAQTKRRVTTSAPYPDAASRSSSYGEYSSDEKVTRHHSSDSFHGGPTALTAIQTPSPADTTSSARGSYNPPCITDVLPGEGPVTGGPKIAVVGTNFHSDWNLSVLFGFSGAAETTRRTDELLVCKLPPSPVPGPARVTLTSTSGILPPSNNEGAVFNYVDTREQDLMGLALQTLAMQRMGIQLDPVVIARGILQMNSTVPDQSFMSMSSSMGTGMYPGAQLQQLVEGHEDLMANLENRLIILLQDAYEEGNGLQWLNITTNSSGQNMLHLAASLGFRSLAALLVEWDADINTTDANGLTALHFACIFRHGETARALMGLDADPEIVDDWGRTAWDLGELIQLDADDTWEGQHSNDIVAAPVPMTETHVSNLTNNLMAMDLADVNDNCSIPEYTSEISGKSVIRKELFKTSFKITSPESTPSSMDSSLPSLPDTSPILKTFLPLYGPFSDCSPPTYSDAVGPEPYDFTENKKLREDFFKDVKDARDVKDMKDVRHLRPGRTVSIVRIEKSSKPDPVRRGLFKNKTQRTISILGLFNTAVAF